MPTRVRPAKSRFSGVFALLWNILALWACGEVCGLDMILVPLEPAWPSNDHCLQCRAPIRRACHDELFGMSYRYQYLWPLVFTSVGLMALCAITAVSLVQQHETVGEGLRENVASRKVATELEECLLDIQVLLKDRVESVEALHSRALRHLEAIEAHADQEEEKMLAQRLRQAFTLYLAHWKSMPAKGKPGHEKAVRDAVVMLETNLLKTCDELLQFNGRRIETTTEQHEQALRQLAWGITGVSGLGGIAGLVLGFGLARAVSQSIRRLQVQIQGAAGRLGDESPSLILTGEGLFGDLHEQMDRLSARIEAIVERLHEREREVLRAEQLAAVGQLATGVAHEIRNPLTSIKMLVQAGLEEEQASLAGEDLRVIEQEIRRMERSLRSFLDFARPPKLERRAVDVLDLVRVVVDLTRGRADKQGVRVLIDAPSSSVPLTADGEQVQQVLVNLALNALDAMPAGGTLTFHVAATPDGGATIRVLDTGAGIAADVLPRLFQPFVSGKPTGLGMGLVISRRLVENHGGTITAWNPSGGGAEFTVTLPAGFAPPGR